MVLVDDQRGVEFPGKEIQHVPHRSDGHPFGAFHGQGGVVGGQHGLIKAEGEGFVPTSTAQELCAAATRKRTYADRLAGIRERLAATELADRHADVEIEDARWSAAIAAHRASAESAGRNELVPRPKAEDARRRPGNGPGYGANKGPGLRQRKPLPARRRKD